MTFTFKLSKRLAIIFAVVTSGALVGCRIDDPTSTSFVSQFATRDTLFSDGFESGALAWDDNFNPLSKQIVTAAARTGTRGLRVSFSPSVDAGTLSKFVTRGDRVYFRAAVRFPSTWTGATGLFTLRAAHSSNRWAGFGVGGLCPSGRTWAVTGVTTTAPDLDLRFKTQYVGMPAVSPGSCPSVSGLTGASTATYTAPLSVSKGVWHTVEIEAKLNTVGSSDGWQRVWLDGALTGEWTGLTFRTLTNVKWNAVSLDMPSVGITQQQWFDIDDIVVQRQRPVPPAPVAAVQVAPSAVTINAGGTAGLTATVRDPVGAALTGRSITWSSSQSSVATVSSSGVVTGVAAGTATITATSEGQSGTATVTVQAGQPAPQALLAESFDDQSFASRGWYDFASTPVVTTADKHSGAGALQIQWAAGSTQPPMKVMRRLFTATDRLFVSYWVKYSTNYVGSGRGYHPHEFNVLSNQDQDYDALTYNYLNTYIEQNYQSGGKPRLSIQDNRMIDAGRIGVNLTDVTEQRSIGGCNGNSDGTGVTECYQMSATQWYNLKVWDAAAVAFQPSPGTDYKGDWNHVEVELRLNSVVGGVGQRDGVVRYWLNGSLKLERTNVMFRTGANPNLKFQQFLVSPYIGDGSPVTQTMWLDDLTIGTARDSATVPPPTPAPVATVAVTPATATVAAGATALLSAALRDAAGTVLTGRLVTWATSAATVATVVNGVVTGVGAGQATITATSEGQIGTAVITVSAPPPSGGGATPVFDLQFDGYASTAGLQAAIQSGATPWLGQGGERELSKVTLVTSGISVPGRADLTKAMRYTWGLAGQGAAQYTIRTILDPADLPAGAERWVEVWARFSAGFTNGAPGGADWDYKFLLFWRGAGSRWNVQMLGYSNGMGDNTQWGFPGDGNTEAAWTANGNGSLGMLSGGSWSSSSVWDGQWHRHRFHLKFGSGNGVATWYVDGRAIHVANNLTISGTFGELFLGANMNVGPTQVQTLDWANIRIWTSNPGWGF